MERLKNKLIRLNTAYRIGHPLVADSVYDRLLEQYEKQTGEKLVLLDYHEYGNVIKLPRKMGSLTKVKTIEDINSWLNNYDGRLSIEPKYDGISILVGNGHAMTRGEDGVNGTIVTDQFSLIMNANDFLFDEEFVRGEVVISKQNFETHFKPIGYSHPRNAVAGLFGSKTPRPDLMKYVEFMPFEDNNKHKIRHQKIVIGNDLSHDLLAELFKKWKETYPIDGVVIKMLDSGFLGYETGTLNPKNQRAYKHKSFDDVYETVVVGIKRQTSKDGVLYPVVVVDPVEVDGAIITNVFADNEMFMKYFGLGVGSNIGIKRSGGIIPRIVSIEDIEIPERKKLLPMMKELSVGEFREKLFFPPDFKDNYVDMGYEWKGVNVVEKKVDDGVSRDVAISQMSHFVSTIKALGFGESTLRYLYDVHGVKSVMDLVKFDFNRISNDVGYSKLIADKLSKSLRESLGNIGLEVAMHSSCLFPGLGKRKLKAYLLDGDNAAGIGDNAREIIKNGLPLWNKYHEEFKKLGYEFVKPKKDGEYKHVYCPTGCRISKDVESEIIKSGSMVTNSYNKKVTHLVVVNEQFSSTKVTKHKKNNGSIITLKELNEKYTKKNDVIGLSW